MDKMQLPCPEPLIDFEELISSVRGEGLEALVRQIGYKKGLLPNWSGRGADRGRDLFFTEHLEGPLSREKITWLVSCKDKASSGNSVTESDLPRTGISDKLEQHKADGFLLVTTTTVSTGAKDLLDSQDKSKGGKWHILIWDSTELTAILLDPSYQDILKQFLPKSYQRVRGLTSLEGAVLAFSDQLPKEVVAEIMRLVRPFSEAALRGEVIWPYDIASAQTIDKIVMSLIVNQDVDAAVEATEEIEFDAFVALISRMNEVYQDECYNYLLAIVKKHDDPDIRFNAAQMLFDKYELSHPDVVDVAIRLDSDALETLYDAEVSVFVMDELYANASDYDVYSSLDELSSATEIDEVNVERVLFSADADNRRVSFSGEISIAANFVLDGEIAGRHSFPGEFTGYFDASGMYLEEASVDTRSYFGDDLD